MAQAVDMNFDVEQRESFAPWFMRTKDRLNELAVIVAKSADLEKIAGQQAVTVDAASHVVDLLTELSDHKLEVCEHTIRAREYYHIKLQKMTEDEIALGWSKAKKTVYDFCVKLDCQEHRVLERLEAMLLTMTDRAIIGQSILKWLRP